MTPLQVEPMPKKKKEKRDDKAVKIDRLIAERAAVIARTEGKSTAEFLSGLLGPQINRLWPGALKKLGADRPRAEDE